MAAKLNMGALKAFAQAIKEDPELLFSHELDFMREALAQYGDLKKPIKKAGEASSGCPHNHDHSHEHSHSHAHDHYEHKPAAAAPAHESDAEDEDEEEEAEVDGDLMPEDPAPYPTVPSGGEDWDAAGAAKEKASEAKSNGNFEEAVAHFTEAMTVGQVSAMTLANRADCLLKLKRPCAAISDCNAALDLNPDSAKALRTRGKAHRFVGKWAEATRDLSAAQRIDFDEDVEALLRIATAHMAKIEAKAARQRNKEEEKARALYKKRKAEIEAARKAAQEEEDRRRSAGGDDDSDDDMPDLEEDFGAGGSVPKAGGRSGAGGFPGGMPGMGGGGGGGDGMQAMLMQLLMGDPELAAGMQNPKIMKAFSSVMSGGGMQSPAFTEAMKDPEVKSFMDKVMKKLGPLMGAMGGGGMPGMGGMGGMPGMGGGMPGFGGPMGGGSMPHFEDEVD